MKRAIALSIAVALLAATASGSVLSKSGDAKLRPNALELSQTMRTSMGQDLEPGKYDLRASVNMQGKLVVTFLQKGRKIGETDATLRGFPGTLRTDPPSVLSGGSSGTPLAVPAGADLRAQSGSVKWANSTTGPSSGKKARGSAKAGAKPTAAADPGVAATPEPVAPVPAPEEVVSLSDLGFVIGSPVTFDQNTGLIRIVSAAGEFAGRGSIEASLVAAPESE